MHHEKPNTPVIHSHILDVAVHGAEEVEHRLWRYIELEQFKTVLKHDSVTAEMLLSITELSAHTPHLKRAYRHPRFTAEMIRVVFDELTASCQHHLAAYLLQNSNCPLEVLEAAYNATACLTCSQDFWNSSHDDNDFLERLIKNVALPMEFAKKLLNRLKEDVPGWLFAEVKSTSIWELAETSETEFDNIQGALYNPSAPIGVMERYFESRLLGQLGQAVQSPNMTKDFFNTIYKEVFTMGSSFVAGKLATHEFATVEQKEKLRTFFNSDELEHNCTTAEKLTEYAKTGNKSRVDSLLYNADASTHDLTIAFHRLYYGDLAGDLDDMPSSLANHKNFPDELLAEAIFAQDIDPFYHSFIIEKLTDWELLFKFAVMSGSLDNRAIGKLIRNQHTPRSLVPLIEHQYKQVVKDGDNHPDHQQSREYRKLMGEFQVLKEFA